jgi:hypothetical protein
MAPLRGPSDRAPGAARGVTLVSAGSAPGRRGVACGRMAAGQEPARSRPLSCGDVPGRGMLHAMPVAVEGLGAV